MKLSIRYRLLVIAGLAVLPALALTIWTGVESVQAARLQGEREAELVVDHAAMRWEQLAATTRQLLEDLSEDPAVLLRDPAACSARFAGVMASQPLYLNIQLIDSKGAVLASGLPLATPMNVADRKYFRDAIQSRSFSVGEYVIGRVVGRPTLNFALPVKNRGGGIIAVLQAGVDLEQLDRVLAAQTRPGMVFVTMDHAGVVLHRSSDVHVWRGKPDLPALLAKMASQSSGTDVGPGIDGVVRVRFWRQVCLPGSNRPYAYVRAGMVGSELYGPAWARLWRNLLVVAMTAVLSLLVAWRSGQRLLVNRLSRVVKASEALAGGDFSARSGLGDSGDEISRLAQSFDGMAERVQQRDARLQRLNRELRALSACNQSLVRTTDEQALLNEVCRIICEVTGYRLAWVGFAEQDESRTVRRVASAGPERDTFEYGSVSWAESPEGEGVTGCAIRTGKTCWVDDMETDPHMALWREAAVRRGFRSSLALPLTLDDGQVLGALTIYSTRCSAFTSQEIRLLEELARDLTFGVTSLRARVAQQRTERELRRARDSAESANRAKDRFLAAASHELRTPLTPVFLLASALAQDASLSPQAKEDLASICEGIEIEKRLIGDLLDFSAIDAGKLRVQRTDADFHEAVRGAVAICQSDLTRKGQTLNVDLASQRSRMQGDPGRLRQICWNLLQNAVKFTPEGGSLDVCTADVDESVVLEVRDSGIGMDQATLDGIFSPFEQGPRTTMQNYGGLGLGLAITRALVEAHGGRIDAMSQGLGRGSVFRVTLPVTLPSQAAAAH